jgi:hypothetical protein
MVDAYTGPADAHRYERICIWLRAAIGHQSHPLRHIPGEWVLGHATVYGWTWIAFRTHEQMTRFLAEWTPMAWEIKSEHIQPTAPERTDTWHSAQ